MSSGGVEPPPPSFARSAPNPSARTLCWSPESNRSRSRTGRVLDLRAAPAFVDRAGIEPATRCLQGSAAPQRPALIYRVESAGIEPASPRCERGVLPLNDDPMGPSGIEPESAAYKAAALPLSYEPVRTAGIEPAVFGMSGRRSTADLRAHEVDRRGLEPRFPRCHRGVLPLDDQPAQCLGVESNHDPLCFKQVLVPHELPRHGASDENRTRPFLVDNQAFPPGNLGGNWGGAPGSSRYLLLHRQACRAATPAPPWSARVESNHLLSVISRVLDLPATSGGAAAVTSR